MTVDSERVMKAVMEWFLDGENRWGRLVWTSRAVARLLDQLTDACSADPVLLAQVPQNPAMRDR